MRDDWTDVSRTSPCPICGKPDRCQRTADGAVRCFRVTEPPPGWRVVKTCRDGTMVFRPIDDGPGRKPGVSNPRTTRKQPARDWATESGAFVKALGDDRLAEFAQSLGVTPESLRAIDCGWDGIAYTFPERDGNRSIIGIATRTPNGRKGFIAGGKRGLIIPKNLDQLPGPIVAVEGPSDTAVGVTLGLAVIGRPSNCGGVDHLTVLLKGREDVTICGENDHRIENRRERWPGRDGAASAARQLADSWDRPVRWTLAPGAAKDLRDWFRAQNVDLNDKGARDTLGRELLESLSACSAVAEPGKTGGDEATGEQILTLIENDGSSSAVFDHIDEIASLDGAAFGKLRARLKEKFGQSVCLRDLDNAARQSRQRQRTECSHGDSPLADDYFEAPAGIIHNRPTRDGPVPTLLTNFTAQITGDVIRDDGVEQAHEYQIEAKLDGQTKTLTIPASRFDSMGWVPEYLGGSAIVHAGQGKKDHARCAIQVLSPKIAPVRRYVHTGWTMIDGQPVFLHGDGAIGPLGPVSGIEVELTGSLAAYRFPAPISDDQLTTAIRASLRVLDIAPLSFTLPIYVTIWRAPLGNCYTSIHASGSTGFGKTELAALIAQHYGPEMHAKHLPASWESTENALEASAFLAKDVPFVIDDFKPSGDRHADRALFRKADRIFRGTGNASGRERMRSDTSLRPAKMPRGLPMSTGEDIPPRHSLRARIVAVELEQAVDWAILSECQRYAADGVYAGLTARYIQYVSSHGRRIQEAGDSILLTLREEAVAVAGHRRSIDNIASLGYGWRVFCDFCVDLGAMSAGEVDDLWHRGWDALLDVGRRQDALQLETDVCLLYMEYLRAAISSGRAHLADANGDPPDSPEIWGWCSSGEGWYRQGNCIGWVTEEGVFLEPASAYKAARAMEGDAHPIAVSEQTLRKRLKEGGYLASTDTARGKIPVRRTLQGMQRTVLHLGSVLLDEPAKPAISAMAEPDLTPGLDHLAGLAGRAQGESNGAAPLCPTVEVPANG